MKSILLSLLSILCLTGYSQENEHNFRIRTITAGVTIQSISDTVSVVEAIHFLKQAATLYTEAGYEVQTLRVSTQHFHEYIGNLSYAESIKYLKAFDRIAVRENVMFSIGQVLPPNVYVEEISSWAVEVISQTRNINFSLPISSSDLGIHINSIRASAEITIAIAHNSKGGEGNFRFTTAANCPANIPFFPAAYHQGEKSFGIGIEYPNLITETFRKSDWSNAEENLKKALEQNFGPIQNLALDLSQRSEWAYDGIDYSPAPGLDASIGEAIETLTGQPFGSLSTLRACALITEVIKNLDIKTCGYSGLMLPVIEDKVLAQRANEKRYTVKELLLYSTVSGTGLDVVPIPGNTSLESVQRMYEDVAALSLKYSNKALSARLFLIPGMKPGDMVEFENPYLTSAMVMEIE